MLIQSDESLILSGRSNAQKYTFRGDILKSTPLVETFSKVHPLIVDLLISTHLVETVFLISTPLVGRVFLISTPLVGRVILREEVHHI